MRTPFPCHSASHGAQRGIPGPLGNVSDVRQRRGDSSLRSEWHR